LRQLLLRKALMLISKELLTLCVNNDRKAQFEFYKASYSFIMRICYRYYPSKDEALVAHNESFLKIVMNLEKYKGEGPIEIWMRRIVINTIIDQYRKEKKLKETISFTDVSDPGFSEIPQDENDVEMKLQADDLYRLIQLLPPMCQKVFNLYVVDGYTHKEIGVLLEISEGTSKSQLFDARKKLQAMLKDYYKPKAAKNEPAE
jgi:RNA polymerase sigma factor (sigma-70 family)